jgi:hypothetical protein
MQAKISKEVLVLTMMFDISREDLGESAFWSS